MDMARERLRPMLLLSQDMATMVDMAMVTWVDMAMVVMVMDMAMARDPLRPSQDMVTMDMDMAMDMDMVMDMVVMVMDMDMVVDMVMDTTDKQYKCFLLAV